MSGTRERILIAQAFGGMWEAYHKMVIKTASYVHEQTGGLVSFPGLPCLQFLTTCNMLHFGILASDQKLEAGKAWERG